MDASQKGGGKVRFIIDGSGGYVSMVETGMDRRAGEAAKVGSIIEVSRPNLRTVDRNIQTIATGKDYHGNPHNGLIRHYAIATSGPEELEGASRYRSEAESNICVSVNSFDLVMCNFEIFLPLKLYYWHSMIDEYSCSEN